MGRVETHNRRKGGGGAEGVCADVLVSFPGKGSEGILSSALSSSAEQGLLVLPFLEKERLAGLERLFQWHFHGRGSAGMLWGHTYQLHLDPSGWQIKYTFRWLSQVISVQSSGLHMKIAFSSPVTSQCLSSHSHSGVVANHQCLAQGCVPVSQVVLSLLCIYPTRPSWFIQPPGCSN